MALQKFSFRRRPDLLAGFVALFAVAGTILLLASHAAGPFGSTQPESGQLAGGATLQTDSQASGGQYVRFGSASGGGGLGGGANMIVGLDAGGWNVGNPGDADVASAVKFTRIDEANCPNPVTPVYPITGSEYTACPAGSDITWFAHNGVKVIVDFSGPYNGVQDGGDGGGVSELIANGGDAIWADNALSWYKKYCGTTNTVCPVIEVLNEPDGWWFWGKKNDPTTAGQTNANAYATLVHTAYTTFHNSLGNNAPAIVATADGSWGQEWWNANSGTLGSSSSYVDGVVSHPYGGDQNSPLTAAEVHASGSGNQAQVIGEHSLTGKPVYVTEVGWPTDVSGPSPTTTGQTGDSMQWPEGDSSGNAYPGWDQCDNVYNFVSWARGTGYVNAVTIYGYIDNISGGVQPAAYGLETWNNGTTHYKDAWSALKAAGLKAANPCPSAANGYTLQPT